RRHTRFSRDWSSDVCSSDLGRGRPPNPDKAERTMWVWTLDDRLINLDVVESIEVIEVYPDDVDTAQLEAGAAEPDLYELVAVSTGGVEYVLFDAEEAEDRKSTRP